MCETGESKDTSATPYAASTFASCAYPNDGIPSTPAFQFTGYPFTPVAAVAQTDSNPETAGPTMFSLHCLCEGSSSVFPVQACHNTTISGLVEQVQQMAGLANVSFVELELWKVSLWHCVRGETYFTPLPTGRHRSHTVQS